MKYRLFIGFIFFFVVFFLFSEESFDSKKVYKKSDTEIATADMRIDDSFYSIQRQSLTACYGEKWLVEDFDENGKVSISVLYEKDKLIEKKEYHYIDNYKSGVDIFKEDKVIKIKYNENGYEIEKSIYDKTGTKLMEKVLNKYNQSNLITETTLQKDGVEFSSIFTYSNANKKLTQTDFVDGDKICFIEYKPKKKIVHIFQFEKETKVLEEDF